MHEYIGSYKMTPRSQLSPRMLLWQRGTRQAEKLPRVVKDNVPGTHPQLCCPTPSPTLFHYHYHYRCHLAAAAFAAPHLSQRQHTSEKLLGFVLFVSVQGFEPEG